MYSTEHHSTLLQLQCRGVSFIIYVQFWASFNSTSVSNPFLQTPIHLSTLQSIPPHSNPSYYTPNSPSKLQSLPQSNYILHFFLSTLQLFFPCTLLRTSNSIYLYFLSQYPSTIFSISISIYVLPYLSVKTAILV